jgi:Na+-transporting methylmalonyl-CoA/oxaloacetate decarboxylase gamma subunit
MQLADALTITILGMSVVFSGLALTSLLIILFGAAPRLLEKWAPRRGSSPDEAPSAEPAPTDRPVAPEVVSVITAVLEVERRLYHAEDGGRLTIARVRST